jgi:hypothetical protein
MLAEKQWNKNFKIIGYEECEAKGKVVRCGSCEELIFVALTVPGHVEFKDTNFCPHCGCEYE